MVPHSPNPHSPSTGRQDIWIPFGRSIPLIGTPSAYIRNPETTLMWITGCPSLSELGVWLQNSRDLDYWHWYQLHVTTDPSLRALTQPWGRVGGRRVGWGVRGSSPPFLELKMQKISGIDKWRNTHLSTCPTDTEEDKKKLLKEWNGCFQGAKAWEWVETGQGAVVWGFSCVCITLKRKKKLIKKFLQSTSGLEVLQNFQLSACGRLFLRLSILFCFVLICFV